MYQKNVDSDTELMDIYELALNTDEDNKAELEALLANWTETLLTNFNDPEIKINIEYVREEHKSLIEEFITRKEISLPVNLKFIDAINELLQGIEKISISMNELASNEAPPISAPSICSCAINSIMFAGFTDPPY